MKKIVLSLVLAAALVMALASCGGGHESAETSGVNTKKPSADTVIGEDDTDPFGETDEYIPPVTEEQPIVVEPGTSVEYKMAFYLDEAKLSEGEKFVQNISNGFMRIDDEFMLNDEDTYQLFWTNTEAGETLTVTLDVPAAGNYSVKITQYNGGDYGKFEYFLGETKIGGEIDCFNTEGGLYDYEMGSCDLAGGNVDFIVRRTGQNDSSGGCVFAISEVVLTCNSLAE